MKVTTNVALSGLLALCFFAASAQAGIILSPVSVSTNASANGASTVDHLIDQSGLDASYTNGQDDTFTSGVDDFATYISGNPQHDIQSDTRFLTSSAFGYHIDFDLGSTQTIHQIAIWNYDGSSLAIKNFALEIANNAAFIGATSVGSFVAAQGSDPRRAEAQVFNMGSLSAQYVRMTINSSYGNNTKGFGEVAFDVEAAGAEVPAPMTVVLMGLGLFGLAESRRIRR